MSEAYQKDANPIDPSVEDDRSNPAEDGRSADADPNKETEPDDPFLNGRTSGPSFPPCYGLSYIKNGAPGGQNSETGAHYLELGKYNGNEWASTWGDAPGLKIDSEWSASDMRTQLDMYMRRG
ncbi:hypothetical protein L198_07979 [Cryptococcus wingfieldii CBS 7118]|uniref:Uncharacterized protein n=1 Tax=Cryptococcus wingfieldii CBS 7118 TaxID=1295528 RepID=A0A1E3HPA6_9TREE|nr:hypothetical protein L198_07979 [Cryptococcus wingfieldii CBS 7118]ODN78190.1 hypothetical protein L198_07979 [Cryptococcus wingfieldii CBS 7118]